MITTQAAVLWQSGTDWKVEEITLDEPRQGEVLVRVAAAGLCHSEEHHVTGDVPFAAPMIGGHEGAGYVEAVGPGVTLTKPGDYVVFSSIPNCGRCPSCARGRQNLCDLAATIGDGLQISDHTSRHHAGRHRPHHHLHGRLLRAAHRGQRGVRDPGGPGGAAGGRLPHRLRGGDRLGQRGVRRRRPGRRRRSR